MSEEKIIVPVPSGKLMFANFFGYSDGERRRYAFDAPQEGRYTTYSLNTDSGVRNLQVYLSKNFGVGHFQTTNMDVEIWQTKNKTEVLILEKNEAHYFEDDLDEDQTEQLEKKFLSDLKEFKKDHKYLGDVACEVWRVECIDKAKLDEEAVDFNTAYNEKDNIIANLIPGNYELIDERFADVFGDGKPKLFEIWGRLKLIEA